MLDVPVPGAGIVLGLKPTVVPVGTPVADNATALLKMPPIVVVMVEDPWVPCCTLSDAGFALTFRLDWPAVTVSDTVVVCCIPPPAAVTVIG